MKHLAKYNSKAPVNNWSNFMDNFFNHSLSNMIGTDMTMNAPAVNVVETADNFRIELAAPGLDKEDFKVEIEKDQLSISAAKEAKEETKEAGKFTRREFNYTAFQRSFRLPENVEVAGIAATYEDGVLNITLPKVQPAEPTVKTIEIA